MLDTKSKNRNSEYVILIAFPLQLWLHERVSTLHYRYTACHVCTLCFPDGAAKTPVCVCCVSARSDRGSVRVFRPKASSEKISLNFAAHISGVALFHKHTEAFADVRSHTYWYTLSFKICFHLPLGLLRCATSSSLEAKTGLGLPPSYSPLCPR